MAIAHNREFDPKYGECVQLGPLLRRVVAKNPNPFTFTGTGVYLLGVGDVAVIDPGPTLVEHLDAVEACLGSDERIDQILVTHTHTDHTAGVPDLKERTGARTVGFGPHGPVSVDDPMDRLDFSGHISAEEDAQFKAEWDKVPDELKREGPDSEFVPDVAVAHGDVVQGEGWSAEVVHTPGHTSNHVCFALRDERGNGATTELFTGDHVMGWATSVISPPDGDLFDYMASLQLLLTRDDVRYWPTHGAAIENPQEYVQSFIDHRKHREDQIVHALQEGPTTITDLVPEMYAEVDKRLWRAAGNSVFSHLLALAKQERVRSADGNDHITDRWILN